MFIALRELRSAWGRFTMIGVVVALVAALVGMVSGFTIGLGNDTVSALRSFNAHSVAFATGTSDFNRSTVSGHDVEAWTSRDDVTAEPLGVSMVRGEVIGSDSTTVDMATFGTDPSGALTPDITDGAPATGPGEIVVSSKLLDEGLSVGDEIMVDNTDLTVRVVGVTGVSSYGHVPAAYTSLDTSRQLRYGTADLDARQQGTASAVVITGGDAPDTLGGTEVLDSSAMLEAAPGYAGEKLTMNSILAFLYVIAPLIVAAFFAVWILQRQNVYALQRALGISRLRLVGATLAQAAIVVTASTVVGSAVAYGLGVLLGDAVPFDLTATSLVATTLAVTAASLVGAAATLRWVVAADPMTMLGESR